MTINDPIENMYRVHAYTVRYNKRVAESETNVKSALIASNCNHYFSIKCININFTIPLKNKSLI